MRNVMIGALVLVDMMGAFLIANAWVRIGVPTGPLPWTCCILAHLVFLALLAVTGFAIWVTRGE